MKHLARAREVFQIEIAALKAVRSQLDDNFRLAVEAIVRTLAARGKVVVDKNEFKGKAGDGKFLKRGTCVAI